MGATNEPGSSDEIEFVVKFPAGGDLSIDPRVSTSDTGVPLDVALASGEVDGPMERHCVRLFLFVEMLAAERWVEIDRELVLCAAFMHDAGLYDSISHGGVYTDEGISGRLAQGVNSTPSSSRAPWSCRAGLPEQEVELAAPSSGRAPITREIASPPRARPLARPRHGRRHAAAPRLVATSDDLPACEAVARM